MTKPPIIIPYSDAYGIAAPRGEESCYNFSIRRKGASGGRRAILTYELAKQQSDERSILLTDEVALLKDEAEKALYNQFRSDLWTKRGARLATAKSVVNHVFEGNYGIKKVKIAVHTYGPVPVFVLDRSVSVPLHGKIVNVRIGLLPEVVAPLSGPDSTRYTPNCFERDSEFMAAMSINPALIFRRYFEDIAEDFHDMRRTLSLERVYQRAKKIETTIGSSIKSKLDEFLPKVELAKQRDEPNKDKWAFFKSNAVQLYEAALTRGFALYLLNEVYSVLGIFSLAGKYKDYIADTNKLFAELLGEQEAYELRQSSDVLSSLSTSLEIYERGKSEPNEIYNRARELLAHASDAQPPWCGEFAKFAEFVLLIHRYHSKGARLFISYHFDVPASDTLKNQIARYVSGLRGLNVRPIAIERLPAGPDLRHVIRSTIWCAQGVIAIVPANTTEISKSEAKGYQWIARECEHALLLKKEVRLGTQTGADFKKIHADFSNQDLGYLVRGSKLASNKVRSDALLRQLEHVHADFNNIEIKGDLDPKLATHVADFARILARKNMDQILDGYMEQFELKTQKALIFSLKALGYRGKHPRCWFIDALSPVFDGDEKKSKSAFDEMRNQVRDRGIDIKGRKTSLLAQPREGKFKDKRYYERLSKVVRNLFPNPTMEEVKLEIKRWLDRWVNKLPVAAPKTVNGGKIPPNRNPRRSS